MFKFPRVKGCNVEQLKKDIQNHTTILKKRICKYERWKAFFSWFRYIEPLDIDNDFLYINTLLRNRGNELCKELLYQKRNIYTYWYKNAKKKFLVEKLGYKIGVLKSELVFLEGLLHNLEDINLGAIVYTGDGENTIDHTHYITDMVNKLKNL